MIAATAWIHRAKLVTKDGRLRSLQALETVW
jgi:predicted nucleic acid-binding protein